MKKQLLCLVGALAFTASFAGHVPPVREMVIPLASAPFVIDGLDDEADWSASQSTDAFNQLGSFGTDADFTFSFKVAYDLDYLYIFASILDDYDNSWDWGGTNQWTYDNVEVFMDLDTNGSGIATAYDTNTIQIRFNRGLDSVNDFGRAASRADYQYYWENTADGWLFESGIPWTFVLGPGQLPEDICQYIDGILPSGFDMSGADSDSDGPDSRDCQTAWDNDEPQTPDDRTEDNAWNNRSVFGVVTFAANPAYCHRGGDINDFGINSGAAYPNPTTGIVTFENVQGTTVEIMNLAGQVVLTSDIVNNKVDLSSLATGVYIAKVGQNAVRIIKQ